jgi:uncharacterized membrane protein YtjA (UPF0391 family)
MIFIDRERRDFARFGLARGRVPARWPPNRGGHRERRFMLGWTLVFLIIALVAGVFGFAGIAGAAVGIARVLFAIFLILFLVSVIIRLTAR